MSTTHLAPSLGSGQVQLKPFLIALFIAAVTAAVSLVFTGLPH
ncbi:MAG TPA: hypothetical protein VND19_22975 [Acetobacteraceae bacterium]|nr:hypothetical protein [Acetobacteraceae bacterium]